MEITYPPEMLPIHDDEATAIGVDGEVMVYCPSCKGSEMGCGDCGFTGIVAKRELLN